MAEAGEGTELPFMLSPDGTVLENPTNPEIALATGSPVNPLAMF